MREYLFVDEERLARYNEQISSPVTFDKVPAWNLSLSLEGPRIERIVERFGRAPGTHEQVERFLEYISEKQLVTNERPSSSKHTSMPFVQETLSARRLRIVSQDSNLFIWIGLTRSKRSFLKRREYPDGGKLILIEDLRQDSGYGSRRSGYSGLLLLAAELEPEGIAFSPQQLALADTDSITKLFATDPIALLLRLGGEVGPTRRIKVLYRFRASCIDTESPRDDASTAIGYPIIIEEA